MPTVSLSTTPNNFQKAYLTSPAPTNESGLTPLALTPPTVGVLDASHANLAKLVFFGTGNADTQFYAHVYAYSPVLGLATNTLWIPTLICKVLCTLSATVGVAAAIVLDTERFCDSIQLIEGDPTVKIAGDVDNRIASLVVDMEGARMLSVRFSTTGLALPASTANFLYATL